MAKDCPPEVAKAMIEKIEMNVPMNELERYVYFVSQREREEKKQERERERTKVSCIYFEKG